MKLPSLALPSLLLCLVCFLPVLAFASAYHPLAEDCDGFAKLPMGTADNVCVGLLVQKNNNVPFKMPRTAIELPNGKLLVVDMGGWVPNKGKLFLVDFRSKKPQAVVVLSDLNMPHKILRGKDGKYYLGEAHRIVRFAFSKDVVTQLETVIDHLPYHDEYLHPLKNFVFDKDNNFIINIGSTSDRCKNNNSDCLQGREAGLWQFNYRAASKTWDQHYTIIASGLRNSMALAVDASGTILQAENSMDLPTAEEPYEEINIIEGAGFYGWPVCYDRNANIDETKNTCTAKNYHEPWSLMPPHVAPLDALYYHHTKLPSLNHKLLMTWHGYKIVGHRLVAFDVDEQGRPLRSKTASYNSDPLNAGEDFKTQQFAAKMGTGLVAQHYEIISRANEISGIRPKSAPADMSIMNDGSLLIVDDKNAAILRLSTGTPYHDSQRQTDVGGEIKRASVTAPENIQKIFLNRCSKCHEQIQNDPAQLLDAEHWLQQTNGKTRLAQKLFDDKVMPMPPDNSLLPDERKQLKSWIDSLK